ncbi:MAG TPA: hypothetical protein PKU69_00415 [Bacillota bacterium]|nr:hypothetical protein [Bacillota bacterium]HPJ23786.1 hypothetical protein [Bacillota bacterium]
MNRKQYITTLAIFGVISIALIVTNSILEFMDWVWLILLISVGYFYVRYRISAPMQTFSTKFNMMVDYDLDVEGALAMVKDYYDNAPNATVKALYQLYLGMAYYYNARYREAINTFNQVDLNKVNPVYHVLIFAFTAYAANEEGDDETFNIALERIEEVKNRVGKRYINFALNYIEILQAIKNLELNPENYLEVIEKNFSRNDGYVSTRLIYNYRKALYYKTIGNVEEMDKCLAAVIANGKNHHTAVQAKILFQNTCNIEDYVFTYGEPEPQDVEVVEDPLQIETMEDIEVVEEEPSDKDKE